MICRIGAVVLTTIFLLAPVASNAQSADIIIEKKTFEMPSYNTVAGATIKSVKIGWEAAGTLNADKSNAILITHYFSGTSHAFGKYATSDKAAGYWDAIIGPGKAIDTNKYYVLSSDTLVNLNAKLPNVVTTGPASINPDTGKPYGLSFPLVSIKDFVRVQKAIDRQPRYQEAQSRNGCLYGWAPGVRMGAKLSGYRRAHHSGDRLRECRAVSHRLARHVGAAHPARSEME